MSLPITTENVNRYVPPQRQQALAASVQSMARQLRDGPVIVGETHTRPEARAAILDMIDSGRVRELFVELGSLQISDLGMDTPPAGGHDRTATDYLREHAGENLTGDPVWEALAEGLNWVDVHPNAIPLVRLIQSAQAAGVAVYFYDNDPARVRLGQQALERRNAVAGQQFQRSASPRHTGTVLLVGGAHLSDMQCGGAENTIQARCGVSPQRVHELS